MMKPNSLLLLTLVFSLLIGGCRSSESGTSPFPPTTQATPPVLNATADVIAAVINASSSKIHSSFLSSDGKWRVEIVVYDCVKVDPRETADANAVEILKLVRISDQTEVIIESLLLYCGGLGAYGFGGLFWSPNNQYFYYTDAREGMPDGCGYWVPPIRRVNIDGLKTELIGGGHYLSPDKTKLAAWQGNEIVIWSLDDGELARLPAFLSNAFPNQIAWSPDGQSLAYLQTEADCSPWGISYLIQLDLSDMTQTLLIESEAPSFSELTWDTLGQINLVDDAGGKWVYDLISDKLEPISQ